MVREKLLIVDVGTSSIRGVVYDRRGRLLHFSRETYSPEFMEDQRVEQEPESWVNGLIRIAGSCSDRAGDVAAVVLTAARSSVVPVDTSGRALSRAIMWQDRRAESICREVAGEESFIYSRTGMKVNTAVSAPKMAWIRRESPQVYRDAAKLLGIQDYLIHFLTGRFVTDHSFGSRTILMNLESRSWDLELARLFGIDEEKLCDLIEPGSVCGSITTECSRLTRIKSGTPVLTAGGDQQCAAIGQGVIASGQAAVNTGTGAYLVRSSDRPVLDPGRGLFCNASAVPERYIVEASVVAAGSLYNWFADLFAPESETGTELFRRIDASIEHSPPGSNGVVLVPSLAGKGSPEWNPSASGAFLNLRLGTTSGDMARAILEGIACELKENLELMRRLAGREISIRSSGGMSGFPLYNQMLADAFGTEVIHRNTTQSTAFGAWIIAAASLGFYAGAEDAYAGASAVHDESRFSPRKGEAGIFDTLLTFRRKVDGFLNALDFPGA